MGSVVYTGAATGSGTPEYSYRPLTRGTLLGMSAYPITEDIPFGQCKIQVGVMRGGEGQPYIVAVFLDDYVSQNHFPYSEQAYQVQIDDRLFVRMVTDVATEIRVGITVDHGAPEA